MGEFCQNCRKEMEHPELTHCSDECLFDEMNNEKIVDDMPFGDNDGWNSKPWI